MQSAGIIVHLEFKVELSGQPRPLACLSQKASVGQRRPFNRFPQSANICDSSIRRRLIAIMSGRFAFSKGLKEVRFLFCQTGEHSAATRSFLLQNYPAMKKDNPATPILIRDASGTLPKVYARFEFGKEKSQSLEGLSDQEIEQTVSSLVKNNS